MGKHFWVAKFAILALTLFSTARAEKVQIGGDVDPIDRWRVAYEFDCFGRTVNLAYVNRGDMAAELLQLYVTQGKRRIDVQQAAAEAFKGFRRIMSLKPSCRANNGPILLYAGGTRNVIGEGGKTVPQVYTATMTLTEAPGETHVYRFEIRDTTKLE